VQNHSQNKNTHCLQKLIKNDNLSLMKPKEIKHTSHE